MNISLTLLTELSGLEYAQASRFLGSLDSPIGGVETAAELMVANTRRAPLTSWLVCCSAGLPAGIFALAPTLRPAFDLQASIYIRPLRRGEGMFRSVYDATADAADTANTTVCSSVAASNQRSVAAHRRVFGGRAPAAEPGITDPTIAFHVFDFARMPERSPTRTIPQLTQTVYKGLLGSV